MPITVEIQPLKAHKLMKSEDNQSLIDVYTGEVTPNGEFVTILKQDKSSIKKIYTGDYVMISQKAHLPNVYDDKEIDATTLRIFLYLLDHLAYNNFVVVSRADLSDHFNISGPNVSKAVKKLLDKEIFFKGPKMGTAYSFRLNPNYGYKGNVRGKVARQDGNVLFLNQIEEEYNG